MSSIVASTLLALANSNHFTSSTNESATSIFYSIYYLEFLLTENLAIFRCVLFSNATSFGCSVAAARKTTNLRLGSRPLLIYRYRILLFAVSAAAFGRRAIVPVVPVTALQFQGATHNVIRSYHTPWV